MAKRKNPDMAPAEYEHWKNGSVTHIGKYKIVPKKDFGREGYLDSDGNLLTAGWVITDGVCNVVPGAGWAATLREAARMVGALMVAEAVTGCERVGPTKERSRAEAATFAQVFHGLMMVTR